MKKRFVIGVAIKVVGTAISAKAAVVTLQAELAGTNEVPPNASPATGVAVMVIDTDTRAFTLDLTFSGLQSPTTMAHIHNAPPGVNGPVIFGLDNPATWALVPLGFTGFSTAGAQQSPTLFPAEHLAALLAGNTYVNIHTQDLPTGEIRGQLVVVPAPAAAGLLTAAAVVALRRRRR